MTVGLGAPDPPGTISSEGSSPPRGRMASSSTLPPLGLPMGADKGDKIEEPDLVPMPEKPPRRATFSNPPIHIPTKEQCAPRRSDGDGNGFTDPHSQGQGPTLSKAVRSNMRRASVTEALMGFGDDTASAVALDTQLNKVASRVGGPDAQSTSEHTMNRDLLVASAVGTLIAILVTCIIIQQQKLAMAVVEASPNAWEGTNNTEDPALVQHFEVNEPLGVFIGVMSLIFALVYASTFTDAQARLNEIRNMLAHEASGVHTAILLVRIMDSKNSLPKIRSLLLFGSYIDNLANEIEWECAGRRTERPPRSNVEMLYAAVSYLAEIADDGDGDEMDRVLVTRAVASLNDVGNARHKRISAQMDFISGSVYYFLVQLGVIIFIGISMLQHGSSSMNGIVSALTAVALLHAMIILLDVGNPWRGFITVDTSVFGNIKDEISTVLSSEDDGADNTVLNAHDHGQSPGQADLRNIKSISFNADTRLGGSPTGSDGHGGSFTMPTSINRDSHLQDAANNRGWSSSSPKSGVLH